MAIAGNQERMASTPENARLPAAPDSAPRLSSPASPVAATNSCARHIGRQTAPELACELTRMKTVQGYATMGAICFNSRVPLADNARFYASRGASHRKGEATRFARRPNQHGRNNLEVYPNGFLPQIHRVIGDRSQTAGLKGSPGGWIVGMGASTGNLDAFRALPAGGMNALTPAVGSGFRVEKYAIEAGQFDSCSLGSGGHKPANTDNNETFGAKTLFDISASHEISEQVTLAPGANNLPNTIPDKPCKNMASPQNTCSKNSYGRFPCSRRVTRSSA